MYCKALKAVLVTRRSFVTIHILKNVKWYYKYRLVDGFGNSTSVFTTKEESSHFSKEYLKDFLILLTDTFNVQNHFQCYITITGFPQATHKLCAMWTHWRLPTLFSFTEKQTGEGKQGEVWNEFKVDDVFFTLQ